MPKNVLITKLKISSNFCDLHPENLNFTNVAQQTLLINKYQKNILPKRIKITLHLTESAQNCPKFKEIAKDSIAEICSKINYILNL